MKKREPLCTVAEAAEILNCCQKTVRHLIKSRRLRAIKINGLVRLDPADLEDFIRDHRGQ
jgi:excisionase family DNA binding protein